MQCPKCRFENPDDAKFCMECGKQLTAATPEFEKPVVGAERKHATVLFCDLAGYTALTEKLDPEVVKEIMGRIFAEAARIIETYEGTVERFFGDEIMALFGVPKAHEDDPLRAIRAAREIHDAVTAISGDYEKQIGRVLRMHSGINTGLMVTGDEYIGKSRHGLTGDTINLGKRLTSIAGEDEIIIGPDTWNQAQGHFNFEELPPVQVKGKSEPIKIYKILTPKEQASVLHRTHGARADLIGRDREMAILEQAAQQPIKGQGSIISVCGDAGTGKSRLTREFKERLDLDRIQWYEGHAYGYTQNTPYYPLIDLLTRAFQIKEGDPPDRIKEKIESGVALLLGVENQAAPYIGGLFSLPYAEFTQISPESWKSRLHESIQEIVSSLAERGPTVICFEDLHWADPSFIELLNSLLKSPLHSILFVCVYRPTFNLFDGQNPERLDHDYHEIRLQELSALDAQAMLKSLLKSEAIPVELADFVKVKAEGNPFYLEEVVNSLIDSEILTRDNGGWKLAQAIGEADIPPSINGVLTARIDRLQKDAKRILQEASVIGRAFFYEILKRVSDLKVPIDEYLAGLEQLDLIRVRALEPDLEYIFKHALTQEVVYNGILKKERQEIHERIGLAIETLFKDRLSEFYETLAYHFGHSSNDRKAVDYLIRSGEKSLQRYALEESHQFYKDSYKILSEKTSITNDEKQLLIDLLINWSFVFHWRIDYAGVKTVFGPHRDLVDSLEDREIQGMYYACLGLAFGQTGSSRESYEYLHKAIKLCQGGKNEKITAYCYAWLTQACAEMGLLDEAIAFGKKGQAIASRLAWDPLLFTETHAWMAAAYYYRGECKEIEMISTAFMEKGNKNSEPRLTSQGYMFMGFMSQAAGDYTRSTKELEKAIRLTKDPIVFYHSTMLLGWGYLLIGRLQEAEDNFNKLLFMTQHLESWVCKPQSEMLYSAVQAAMGKLSRGIKNLHRLQAHFSKNDQKFSFVAGEYILGNVYSQMVQRTAPKDFEVIFKNLGFLIKTIPFAAKKAERHFQTAIQTAEEIGAKGLLGQSYLGLGLLCKNKKKNDEARHYISNAIKIFEECEAYALLEQAREELESLR